MLILLQLLIILFYFYCYYLVFLLLLLLLYHYYQLAGMTLNHESCQIKNVDLDVVVPSDSHHHPGKEYNIISPLCFYTYINYYSIFNPICAGKHTLNTLVNIHQRAGASTHAVYGEQLQPWCSGNRKEFDASLKGTSIMTNRTSIFPITNPVL